MIVSSQAAIWACEHLTPEDFFREAHAAIFVAMKHLVDHKIEVDFVTLNDYFKVRNEVEDIGGAVYIASLADGVPKGTNIQYYAGIVQNDRVRRELLRVSDHIVAEVVEGVTRGTALVDRADGWLLQIPRPDREDDLVIESSRTVALREDFNVRVNLDGRLLGLDTGLEPLNEATGGLKAGELTIVAARPSVGKTALAGHLSLTAAQYWKAAETKDVAAFFSLEMSREQVEYRFISDLTGVYLFSILNGRDLTDYQIEKVEAGITQLGQLPIAIDSTGRITVETIRSKARRLQAMRGLGLLVVDYVQLVTGSGVTKTDRGNRNVELTHVSRSLKMLAKELNIPVIMLSQLSRAPEGREDKRPKMSDLRESGALEQDADNVWLLHTVPKSDNGRGSCAVEIIVEKQRNGPTGIHTVFFEKEIMRWREVRPEDRVPIGPPPDDDDEPVRKTRAKRPPAHVPPGFFDE